MNIEYVPSLKRALYNSSSLTQFGGGGGNKSKFGTVLAVVAAIAIPFVAPAIAGALFGSATIMGTAIIGAGLGALAGAGSAKLSGGDVMKGALMGAGVGALGGGIGAAAGGATLFGGATTGIGAGLSTPSAMASGAGGFAGLSTPSAVASGAGTGLGGAGLGVAGGGRFSQVTQSLLRASPQLIGQAVASMRAPDQAEYLAQLEAEMETYKGRDNEAYQQRLQLYQAFLNEARAADPSFDMRLAEAKVQRQQALQYQQNMEALRLTNRTEEEMANEARRFAVEGAGAQHAAGVNAAMGASDRRAAALSRAAGVATQPNAVRITHANSLYNIAGNEANAVAKGAANTAQMLIQPFTYSNYRLGARRDNDGIYGNMSGGIYGDA